MQNISVLYGGQVLNMLDWETIVALAETHFALPKSEVRWTVEYTFKTRSDASKPVEVEGFPKPR